MPSDKPSNRQIVNTELTSGNIQAKCLLCFEASNTEASMRAPAVLDDCVIMLSEADMNKTFKQVNIHKAAGPDGLPGRVLKACVDKLESVFTDIFNLSLTESVISTCFKQTTISPVPKNAKVTCVNDYRHIYSHL